MSGIDRIKSNASMDQAAPDQLSPFALQLAPLLANGPVRPLLSVMGKGAGFDSGVEAAAKAGSRILGVQVSKTGLTFFGEVRGALMGAETSSFPQMIQHLATQRPGDLVVAISQTEAAGGELSAMFLRLAQSQMKAPTATLIFQTSDPSNMFEPLIDRCVLLRPTPSMELASRLAAMRESAGGLDKTALEIRSKPMAQ